MGTNYNMVLGGSIKSSISTGSGSNSGIMPFDFDTAVKWVEKHYYGWVQIRPMETQSSLDDIDDEFGFEDWPRLGKNQLGETEIIYRHPSWGDGTWETANSVAGGLTDLLTYIKGLGLK